MMGSFSHTEAHLGSALRGRHNIRASTQKKKKKKKERMSPQTERVGGGHTPHIDGYQWNSNALNNV